MKMQQPNLSEFNRDTAYWNNFYKNKMDIKTPSLFACNIIKYLKKGNSLLELGCGNGRDSLYFFDNGIKITAVDASDAIISKLQSEYNNDSLEFICDDFVSSKEIYHKKYDYCYSRFTIHAICEEQENELIKNVYNALKNNGSFFIEARSINDDIYGKGEKVARNSYIYNNHFRRFISIDELTEKLIHVGFSIDYAEEKTGFAPLNNCDPPIIRIVASKKQPVNTEDINQIVSYDYSYEDNGYEWLSCSNFNGLFKLDKVTGIPKYMHKFMNSNSISPLMHHKVYEHKGKLHFMPDGAEGISIYNLSNNELQYLQIKDKNWTKYRGIDSIRIENKIWIFFAYLQNPIIIYDLDSSELKKLDILQGALQKNFNNPNMKIFWSQLSYYNGHIYGAVDNTSYFIDIDTNKMNVKCVNLSNYTSHIANISVSNETVYLSEYDCSDIISYDICTKNVKKYTYSCELLKNYHLPYSNIIADSDKLFIIPNELLNEVLLLDPNIGEIVSYATFPNNYTDNSDVMRKSWRRFFSTVKTNNSIICYPARAAMRLEISLKEQVITGSIISFDEKWMNESYKDIVINPYLDSEIHRTVLSENKPVKFTEFLSYLQDSSECICYDIPPKLSGKTIFEMIISNKDRTRS